MGHQLPSFWASTRSRSNSCGVSWTRRPPTVTSAFRGRPQARRSRAPARRRVSLGAEPHATEPATLRSRTASACSRRRRHRAQRPSRLVTDDREHEHGRRAPGAQLPADLCAASIRKHQVENDRVRRPHRRGGERGLGSRGRVDLVAGAAEVRLQGAQDLRLVVHDEHARPLIGTPSAEQRRPASQARMSRLIPSAARPTAGSRSPRRSRGRSRARGPSPAARAPCSNGSKIRSRCRRRGPAPVADRG